MRCPLNRDCNFEFQPSVCGLIEPAWRYDRWEKTTILSVLSHIIAHPGCLDSDSEATSSSGVPTLLQDDPTDDCSQHFEPQRLVSCRLCPYCAFMQCRLLWHRMSRQTSTRGWYSSSSIHQNAPRAWISLLSSVVGLRCHCL